MAARKLKDDCFALPPGVDWTPVDTALELLQERLTAVVTPETTDVTRAAGRVLAANVTAQRANPPTANSAVDGYGFAYASLGEGDQRLTLMEARSAAGQPFHGVVPPGSAIRILTGAFIPEGVDTVLMQEDAEMSDRQLWFQAGLKPGANTRRAGEDVAAGETLFAKGHRLGPPDIALLVATGTAEISVFRQLRVGVLSTGDEILPAGSTAADHQIYDANRPMLLAMLARWGMEPVDLGHAPDERTVLRTRLNAAAVQADAILTSGGASAGDEDHLSAILNAEGMIHSWRIALKPGRPLALGQWQGVPLFGLPGNPVAALVCSLIFARPALGQLGGENWRSPVGYRVPAAFSKVKKAGRREYLRARLNAEGQVELFASEGSGRISGLSWADGLVELPDEALDITPGDLVRYLPFGAFGL